MSNTAGPSTFVFSADCLRGVLDDNEIVSFGDPHYGIHVRHLAIQVDRDDCAASIRHFRLQSGRVEVVSGPIDVDEDWSRSDAGDRARRREEGVRGCNHLVAGTDVFRHQAR